MIISWNIVVVMKNVDALSTNTISTIEENSFEQNMELCQTQELKNNLVCNKNSLYELRNDLVYRKVDNGSRILFYAPD